MNIFEHFDNTYIINLPDRVDRKRQCLEELRCLGIDLEASNIDFFKATRPDSPNGFPSIGAHGSLLSRIALMKHAMSRHEKRILVLEDDIAFNPKITSAIFLAKLRDVLETEWGFIYFGHNVNLHVEDDDPKFRKYDGPIMLAHCMAFNLSIGDQLISYMEDVLVRPVGHPDGGKVGFDPVMNMFRMKSKVTTVIAVPCMAYQRPSRTDLGHDKWFDRIPVLRQLAHWSRNLRSALSRWKRYRN